MGHIPSGGPSDDAPGPHSLTGSGRVHYNDYCLESITFIYIKGVLPLNPTEVAQLVVEVASERLAADIVMLDLRRLASFADYFVVMTADSSRQIEALEDDISKAMREAGVNRYHREGVDGFSIWDGNPTQPVTWQLYRAIAHVDQLSGAAAGPPAEPVTFPLTQLGDFVMDRYKSSWSY